MNFIYKWRWELAAPLAGVCATLAFAPFDYAFLMVLSLFLFFYPGWNVRLRVPLYAVFLWPRLIW
jgi:hypothetical protein